MRMTRRRKALLKRIEKEAKEAGTTVDIEDLSTAPLCHLQFCSIYLQLHKK